MFISGRLDKPQQQIETQILISKFDKFVIGVVAILFHKIDS